MKNANEQSNSYLLSAKSNSLFISMQGSNENIKNIITPNSTKENQTQISNQISPNLCLNNFSNNLGNNKEDVENNCHIVSDKSLGTEVSLTRNIIISGLRNKKTAFMMQNILSEAPKEQIDIIVKELKGKYWELIREKNGNYFCNDLFRIIDQEQRIAILTELTKTISDDCTNKFANYPIQTLIEFSSSEKEYELIMNSFDDYNKLLIASFDSFGSHVIHRIIEHIPEKFRTKFNLLFILIIPYLSLKQYGVCCVKKFISLIKNDDLIDKIINIIRMNFVQIATNNYGNFVIQFMLKKWINTKYGNKLRQTIRDNFKILYQNKYSYYICDFYLKLSSKKEKVNLMNMILFNKKNNQITINNENDIISHFITQTNLDRGNNMAKENKNLLPLNFFYQFNNIAG